LSKKKNNIKKQKINNNKNIKQIYESKYIIKKQLINIIQIISKDKMFIEE
jgi:hypothetical protein